MEELNYHKLVNLRKRILKYEESESVELILEAVDKALAIEKQKSRDSDRERRMEYQLNRVCCDICGKEMNRASLYKHKNTHT